MSFSLQYFREGLEKAESKEAAKILYEKEVALFLQLTLLTFCPEILAVTQSIFVQKKKSERLRDELTHKDKGEHHCDLV